MSLGEAVLKGETAEEVLITSDICHPSLGNDELSGPLALAFLYRRIASWPKRKLTYRFVLHPETIGSIAYLSLRGKHLAAHCVAGFVLSNTGVARHFATSARAAAIVLPTGQPRACCASVGRTCMRFRILRRLAATSGNIARRVLIFRYGVLSRTPDHYPEYHTSLDNRDFVSFEALSETVDAYEAICRKIDASVRYRNLSPYGEPQLG